LTMPSPMPEYLNVHYIGESASRLLFLSMHWALSIPSFQALGSSRPRKHGTDREISGKGLCGIPRLYNQNISR
ncbi:NR2C1 isoform 2, partial [Pan troglodytes]